MLTQLSKTAASPVFLSAFFCIAAGAAEGPEWIGKGRHRILVRVDPIDLGRRTADEMPTRIHISAHDIRTPTGQAGKIDVASLQVGRYEPASGKPVDCGRWSYAHTSWEIPCRWYDDSIPEAFPEVLGNVDTRTGELTVIPQHNWGYFYESLGEWDGGNLAWIHTQSGQDASYYAIYFDLLPTGAPPEGSPRTGYVGDGAERIEETPPATHGLLLGRVDTADWNGDGLVDLLVGCERGGMIWFPNRGTAERPKFPYHKLVFTADGKPLDVGFNSAPVVVDWDGDDLHDVVSAAYPDRAVWYRNTGTNASPRLEYRGLVFADGAPLHLPYEPVPEGEGIYPTDYFPTLAAVDWDGDGDTDLLAGGYITGMIFLFENLGRSDQNLPLLTARGPLQADGRPIDTQWCAAPAVGDVDADGDLDLLSGSMSMTAGGGDSASSEHFLYFFRNVGSRTGPRLTQEKFPVKGSFPAAAIAGPRLVDLNNDGLLDLVVARTTDLSIYYNVGTKTSPIWEFSPPLPGRWGTAPLFGWGTQLMDWDSDGRFDLVQGFGVRPNLRKGNPEFFGPSRTFIGPGERSFHKSPSGDQWTFTHVADVDGDGRHDILYGVHEGWVYLHRNLTCGDQAKFDTQGVRLNTRDGNPIKVGPAAGQKMDFDVLQGARTTLAAADFDRDDKTDLIIGDTYGVMRYYRNATGGPNPTFEPPEVVADFKMRLVPSIADWNADGWPDVLVGSSRAFVVLNNGRAEGRRFAAPKLIDPPSQSTRSRGALEQIPGSPEWRLVESAEGAGLYLPYECVLNAADWNGDGDEDLMALASYGYLCWFERSFLDHGYAAARVERAESR